MARRGARGLAVCPPPLPQPAPHTRLPAPTSSCTPTQDEYKGEPGTVVAADFYGASRLLPLSGGRALGAGSGRPTAVRRLLQAPSTSSLSLPPCPLPPAHPPHHPPQTTTSSARCRPTWQSASLRSGMRRWAAPAGPAGGLLAVLEVGVVAQPAAHSPCLPAGTTNPMHTVPPWLPRGPEQVVDAAVLRFPRAVTHFSPGSAQWRPTQVRWRGRQGGLGCVLFRLVCVPPAVPTLACPLRHPTRLCRPPALRTCSWRVTGSRGWTTGPTACRRRVQSAPPPLLARQPQPAARRSALHGLLPVPLVAQPAPGARSVQERAWITGLAAANLVVQRLGVGQPADILPGALEPSKCCAAAAGDCWQPLTAVLALAPPLHRSGAGRAAHRRRQAAEQGGQRGGVFGGAAQPLPVRRRCGARRRRQHRASQPGHMFDARN